MKNSKRGFPKKHIMCLCMSHTVIKAEKRKGNSMRIAEIFKSNSEEERREAVTRLMIQLESKKHKEADAAKRFKAG